STLPWNERDGSATLAYVRELLAARHTHVVPLLDERARGLDYRVTGSGAFVARWSLAGDRVLSCAANLSATPQALPELAGTPIGGCGDDGGAWSVRWTLA
ncbi:MAG: DUF3459 domain-containing protein, partial [Gammaproteobacteria bacterium]|nr:DUF3459 domain-containing protein [Gammaproteobacteria bacterium]